MRRSFPCLVAIGCAAGPQGHSPGADTHGDSTTPTVVTDTGVPPALCDGRPATFALPDAAAAVAAWTDVRPAPADGRYWLASSMQSDDPACPVVAEGAAIGGCTSSEGRTYRGLAMIADGKDAGREVAAAWEVTGEAHETPYRFAADSAVAWSAAGTVYRFDGWASYRFEGRPDFASGTHDLDVVFHLVDVPDDRYVYELHAELPALGEGAFCAVERRSDGRFTTRLWGRERAVLAWDADRRCADVTLDGVPAGTACVGER